MNLLDEMFQGNDANLDSKKLSKMHQLVTPVVFSNSDNPKLTLILDTYPTTRELALLKTVLFNKKIESYQILYSCKVKFTEKDLSTGIWKKYRDFSWNFEDYIPRWSKVISFGRAMYSITKSNDLDCSLIQAEDSGDSSKGKDKFSIINGFYDHILWKTSFFDSRTCCQIFPVDKWVDLLSHETGLIKNSFEYWFFGKQLELALTKELKPLKFRKIKTIIVEDPNEFLIYNNSKKELIGYDIETGFYSLKGNGFDPWSKDTFIHCITIAFESDPYTGYFLRYKDIDLSLLNEFLKDRPLVGSNLKFDGKFTNLKAGVPTENFRIVGDTVQLQQLCNETMRKGLKAGAWLYTPYGGYDFSLDEYLESHPEIHDNYSKIPEEVLSKYATTDPCISLLVHKEQIKYRDDLDEVVNKDNPYGYNLKWSYENIIIPTLNLFIDVELEGIYIDKSILKEKELLLLNDLAQIEKDILKDLGEKINLSDGQKQEEEETEFWETSEDVASTGMNVSSSTQLGKKLEELGWPIIDRAKNGTPKTGEEQLSYWAKKGYKLAEKILTYREKSKLISTYVGVEKDKSGMYKWIKDDGRVHSLYNNFGALSWRHTSSQPNGQNWVSHSEKAALVRSYIVPTLDKRYGFLSTDFAGLQLRLIGMISKDPAMIQAFKYEGGDIHSRTAYDVMVKYMSNIPSLNEMQKLRKIEDEQGDWINDMRFKSKCFVAGTKINTSQGYIEVEKFIPPINTGEHTPYFGPLKIMYDGKQYEIESTYYDESDTTILFELENGDKMEVTPTHTVVVYREGKEIEIFAKDVLDTDEFISI